METTQAPRAPKVKPKTKPKLNNHKPTPVVKSSPTQRPDEKRFDDAFSALMNSVRAWRKNYAYRVARNETVGKAEADLVAAVDRYQKALGEVVARDLELERDGNPGFHPDDSGVA